MVPITFNTSKCKRMHIGKDNLKFEYTMTTENSNNVRFSRNRSREGSRCLDFK